MPQDSTGKYINVGDKVRFRGQIYTVKAFGPKEGRFDTHTIEFEEDVHVSEIPDEISVDRVG